jgi:hypothetical protein
MKLCSRKTQSKTDWANFISVRHKHMRKFLTHHWNIILSMLVLGASGFYFLAGLYSFSTHYTGAFIVTSTYFRLFDLTVAIISNLQVLVFFIWVVICSILVFSSRKYWWVNLICLILLIPFFLFGTLFGSLPLKTSHSFIESDHAYHLNYIFDGDDGYGYYSLLRCDSLDISCEQIFKSSSDFRKIDKDAQIQVDVYTQELSIIVENKMLYSQPLE